jgi:hypothetical protein
MVRAASVGDRSLNPERWAFDPAGGWIDFHNVIGQMSVPPERSTVFLSASSVASSTGDAAGCRGAVARRRAKR